MLNINSPIENCLVIADKFKERRVQYNLTQLELAQRSTVSLGTLRRFETTGKIALEALMKIAAILDLSAVIVEAIQKSDQENMSLDEMMEKKKKVRVRASRRRGNS